MLVVGSLLAVGLIWDPHTAFYYSIFLLLGWIVAGMLMHTQTPFRDLISKVTRKVTPPKPPVGRFEGILPQQGDVDEDDDNRPSTPEIGRFP